MHKYIRFYIFVINLNMQRELQKRNTILSFYKY
jgi:hypothetical protein